MTALREKQEEHEKPYPHQTSPFVLRVKFMGWVSAVYGVGTPVATWGQLPCLCPSWLAPSLHTMAGLGSVPAKAGQQ